MKTLPSLALAAALSLAFAISGHAQGRPAGAPAPHPTDASAAVAHLANAYATLAPFDANADGTLAGDELSAVAAALVAGKIQPGAHRLPPPGVKPDPDVILTRIAFMYATTATFDANGDGQLDTAEQAALAAAIADGSLRRPGSPRGGKPHR